MHLFACPPGIVEKNSVSFSMNFDRRSGVKKESWPAALGAGNRGSKPRAYPKTAWERGTVPGGFRIGSEGRLARVSDSPANWNCPAFAGACVILIFERTVDSLPKTIRMNSRNSLRFLGLRK